MGATRLTGQNAEVQITENGQLLDTLTAIVSADFTVKIKLLTQGYLGETTERKDDIFMGVGGKMKLHLENKDWGRLLRSIVNRARRRQTNEQINVSWRMTYPTGEVQKFVIGNVFFSDIPVGFSARDAYVEVDLNFEAEDFRTF